MDMNWKSRSREAEEMDDLELSGDRLIQTLEDLSKVHRWLGGHHQLIGIMDELIAIDPTIRRLVDFGCGGGDSLNTIYNWSQANGKAIQLMGLDANASIIAYAEQKAEKRSIKFFTGNIFTSSDLEVFKDSDVAVFSLFLHHFSDEEILGIFRRCADLGFRYVIVTDLQRSVWAYRLFNIGTYLFPFSEMARDDGLRSIRKGFRGDELRALFEQSPYAKIHKMNWEWAFRYVAIAECTQV
jgi:2-polyprenyl-3-methyl-5-hydroxy-6-metoxy-1,4-benzoquinol methylase